MSAPARVAPRPAAPASSTAPAAVAAPKAALTFSVSAETLARIEAVLAPGETPKQLIAKALGVHIETREAARSFRKALGLDAPATAPGPVKAGCANGCTQACADVAEPREEAFS